MLSADDLLVEDLDRALQAVTVRAWRMWLATGDEGPTVPMLRGVWGKALREVSIDAYREVFEGADGGVPRYVLRPAGPEVEPKPALELLLFTAGDQAVWAAWERACQLGPGKQRQPFSIRRACPLAWDGTVLEPARRQPGFHPRGLPTLEGNEDRPCRLRFQTPLRILRDDRLIETPAPADLAIAAVRRLRGLTGAGPLWDRRHEWTELASRVLANPWKGARFDFQRWSGSQQEEITLRGVAGHLDLPEGPGPLAPLLAAAEWLHLGKATVMGLGQLQIELL